MIRLPFPFQESGCRNRAIFNRCDMHDHVPRKLLGTFICKLSDSALVNYSLCEVRRCLFQLSQPTPQSAGVQDAKRMGAAAGIFSINEYLPVGAKDGTHDELAGS